MMGVPFATGTPAAIGLADSLRSVPPNGSDQDSAAARIDEVKRDLARDGRHLGPVADPTQVARISERHHGHALSPRLGDTELHRLFAHHLPKPELPVDHRHHIVLEHDLERLIGDDLAGLEPFDVNGDADHSVRVVTDEVGLDQVMSDVPVLPRPTTSRGEHVTDKTLEPVVGDVQVTATLVEGARVRREGP